MGITGMEKWVRTWCRERNEYEGGYEGWKE